MRGKPEDYTGLSDIDQMQLETALYSSIGQELRKRLTPPPTAKQLLISNPTKAKEAYFNYKESNQ